MSLESGPLEGPGCRLRPFTAHRESRPEHPCRAVVGINAGVVGDRPVRRTASARRVFASSRAAPPRQAASNPSRKRGGRACAQGPRARLAGPRTERRDAAGSSPASWPTTGRPRWLSRLIHATPRESGRSAAVPPNTRGNGFSGYVAADTWPRVRALSRQPRRAPRTACFFNSLGARAAAARQPPSFRTQRSGDPERRWIG